MPTLNILVSSCGCELNFFMIIVNNQRIFLYWFGSNRAKNLGLIHKSSKIKSKIPENLSKVTCILFVLSQGFQTYKTLEPMTDIFLEFQSLEILTITMGFQHYALEPLKRECLAVYISLPTSEIDEKT